MLQEKQMLDALTALKNGDFSVRLPTGQGGTDEEIARTFNELMENLTAFTSELMRVVDETGFQSKLGAQMDMPRLGGTWNKMAANVNIMAYTLTVQLRNIAEVCVGLLDGKPIAPMTAPAV